VYTDGRGSGPDVQQDFNEGSITHNNANVQHLDELYSVYSCNRKSLDGNMYNYHKGIG